MELGKLSFCVAILFSQCCHCLPTEHPTAAKVATAFHPLVTGEAVPPLAKREPMRDYIINKDYAEAQAAKTRSSTSSEAPEPWLRTIYSTVPEIVTPTVIGGITFGAKPPKTTDGLEPWVSLKKDGSPNTIRPKMKDGKIKDGRPNYSTYFESVVTMTYSKEELKAHNMKEDEIFVHKESIPEDQTYVSLNPLIRCTPQFYHKKGLAKHESSEPICFPHEDQKIKLGKVHFLSWYTHYFTEGDDDQEQTVVEKVKIHFAYLKPSAQKKDMRKREIPNVPKVIPAENYETFQGDIPGTFFSSEWIPNTDGYFPIEVKEEWLKGKQFRLVFIGIQPESVSDEDYDLLNGSGVMVQFAKGAVVSKTTKQDMAIQESPRTGDDMYYIIMTMPTVVVLAVCFMYLFLYLKRNQRDVSKIKKPKRSRFGLHKNVPPEYDRLPRFNGDVRMNNMKSS
ncbi:hypothetical protein PP7435_CHR1-0444 [Komagataella phaffii CBS 7435]|uniref:Uncharacterized protein n=2 Tax=Komagataella phaffii TaxID=460519 RepID=C4QW75_KOMPG|nr:uncharacterized protein PAS_chr1-1_0134 [Komagataella phaffii GS115]AOA61023.1 GQ67_02711T0 [Komagataella phaffii]CAH2446166.1 hypothetical protein BQ9382_C1-2300 [Komagataella phaffii CBS 7435]AOA66172.1 GQ68_02537T0 [Komagataella phaffii GS115]CAY67498.1 Putative protein of unknown function [Komagataella phaffii GS115]CCA36597.1 hypothetical protein PP7435_CHR1-0444 [Komagataella phaffii CBS 7435]